MKDIRNLSKKELYCLDQRSKIKNHLQSRVVWESTSTGIQSPFLTRFGRTLPRSTLRFLSSRFVVRVVRFRNYSPWVMSHDVTWGHYLSFSFHYRMDRYRGITSHVLPNSLNRVPVPVTESHKTRCWIYNNSRELLRVRGPNPSLDEPFWTSPDRVSCEFRENKVSRVSFFRPRLPDPPGRHHDPFRGTRSN